MTDRVSEPTAPPHGVFAGLATLDVVHHVDRRPGADEKVTATAQYVAAGGPAANAAVTFAALGGRATLVTALGRGPVADLVRADLASYGVEVVDVAADDPTFLTPVSSIAVEAGSGLRSVVGLDAATADVGVPPALAALVSDAAVVLVDGHHATLTRAAAAAAARRGLPVVLDAGRWKPVMADLLPLTTDAVCSAGFRIPGAEAVPATVAAATAYGVATVVRTGGAGAVDWWTAGGEHGETHPPAVDAVDTLGAGDAFHGAYAHALASGLPVRERLDVACAVAATKCAYPGPRAWLSHLTSTAAPVTVRAVGSAPDGAAGAPDPSPSDRPLPRRAAPPS